MGSIREISCTYGSRSSTTLVASAETTLIYVTLPELMKSGYSEYTHVKGGHLQINLQKKHFGAIETHGDGMHVIVKHYAACGSESSGSGFTLSIN